MRTIKGFVITLLLMILLSIINELYFKIGEFIIGWTCCLVYLSITKRIEL